MNLLDKIGREFSGFNLLESGKRLFDQKPLQCSIYLTDRCNLDCSYCTEYDNSRPHPKLEDLKLWIKKIRDLGTMRIALVGGEPLLHPNVVEIVRYCRELGFATSLTTNGFLLTRKLVAELEDAGLQVMQISVDRMTPSPITKKSFKTILPKQNRLERLLCNWTGRHPVNADLHDLQAGIFQFCDQFTREEKPVGRQAGGKAQFAAVA